MTKELLAEKPDLEPMANGLAATFFQSRDLCARKLPSQGSLSNQRLFFILPFLPQKRRLMALFLRESIHSKSSQNLQVSTFFPPAPNLSSLLSFPQIVPCCLVLPIPRQRKIRGMQAEVVPIKNAALCGVSGAPGETRTALFSSGG
jgi:hypothetical protein